MELLFVLAAMIGAPTGHADSAIVKRFVPPAAPVVRAGGGKKNHVVDLFGVCTPIDALERIAAVTVTRPSPQVPTSSILE